MAPSLKLGYTGFLHTCDPESGYTMKPEEQHTWVTPGCLQACVQGECFSEEAPEPRHLRVMKPSQREREVENLLDCCSLKGHQIGHELGVHSGKVSLGDFRCGVEGRLLQLRGESQDHSLGQGIQLDLREAAHPFNWKKAEASEPGCPVAPTRAGGEGAQLHVEQKL